MPNTALDLSPALCHDVSHRREFFPFPRDGRRPRLPPTLVFGPFPCTAVPNRSQPKRAHTRRLPIVVVKVTA